MAVGIAFIVLFSAFGASFAANPQEHGYFDRIDVTLGDLKDVYHTNEPISFTVHTKGISDNLCNYPKLHVQIVRIEDGKAVWNTPPTFETAMQCGSLQGIDREWRFGYSGEELPYQSALTYDKHYENSIAMQQDGNYRVVAEFDNHSIEKLFQVISANSGMSVSAEQVPDGQLVQVDIEDSDNSLSDYSQVPPKMSMVVYPPANQSGLTIIWKGETGSYCWSRICADTMFIVPELEIEIRRGSTVEFQVSDYEQPDELGVIVYQDANELADQQLVDLPNDEYLVDLPEGDYVFFVGATWMEGEYSTGDATYYYKIKVI